MSKRKQDEHWGMKGKSAAEKAAIENHPVGKKAPKKAATPKAGHVLKPITDDRFPAGNLVEREYRGKVWVAEALKGGGFKVGIKGSAMTVFRSLTQAAKTITGIDGTKKQISGPGFFGLWKPKEKAKKAAEAKPVKAPKAKKAKAKQDPATKPLVTVPKETSAPIDPTPDPDFVDGVPSEAKQD